MHKMCNETKGNAKMYAVAVQNTETDELSLMGPFDDEEHATMIRDSFVAEMDARCDFTVVYSVWIVPLRNLSTEINMFRAFIDLFERTDPQSRTLENYAGLDV